MSDSRQAATRFCTLLIGLTILALILTWAVAFALIPPPRSLLFWIALEFFSMIEVVACLLWLNSFARERQGVKPDTAVLAITVGILAIDAAIGTASIVLYAVVRWIGENDAAFAAWMALLNGSLFIAAAMYYGYSLFFAHAVDGKIIEGRAAFEPHGVRLQDTISQLRSVSAADDDHAGKLDRLVKDLTGVASAITHANGATVTRNQSAHEVVLAMTPLLDTVAGEVQRITNGEQDFTAAHDRLRNTVNELKRKVDAAGLA